jgi:hypothetical protein
MWNGDHLVRIEDYKAAKEKTKRLRIIELWVIIVKQTHSWREIWSILQVTKLIIHH